VTVIDDTVRAHALAVRERIRRACDAAGRETSEVTLIGVTKTHPPQIARAAVRAGIVDLGENRVEELEAKRMRVDGARWHLVGRLQRRSANAVVGHDILIHSVDRRSLVDRLERLAERSGSIQPILIQVNVGDDPAKGGCSLDEVTDLVAYARARPHLRVEGLMTMPPQPADGADPCDAARPFFGRLRHERDDLAARWPEVRHLSMGMSADLEAAVAEGATMVRIGTALFGERGEGAWQPLEETR
jgi:PLP dependent protein